MKHEISPDLSPVRLEAAVDKQDAQHLVLRYTLTNPLAQRIYLFAPPLRFGPHAEPEPLEDSAWVFHEGDHGVRLVRALLRPPMWIKVAGLPTAIIPVEPGASYTGRIVLSLPLAESRPYMPPEQDAGELYSVHQARLQMGWVEARDSMEFFPYPLSNGTMLLTFDSNWGRPRQRVAEVVLPLAGVSLRRHHDSLVERPAVPTQ